MPPSKSDAEGGNECSSTTIASCFARLGTQEQKVAVSALLTSGTKRARFEASIEEVTAPMLKVFYELPEYWASIAMMAHTMRTGALPHDHLALELKKSLCARRKTIDELPKMEHVALLPNLVQTKPIT